MLYGFEGTLFLLPKFDTDWLFVLDFCQPYLYWSSFLEQKYGWQFIQAPFSIGNVYVQSNMNLKEVSREFELCEFIEGPTI